MIGGIIASILGSPTVISKGMELIDDAFETDEERRESKTQAKIQLMKAYAPFKVAQRYIALLFTVVYLFTYILAMVFTLQGQDVSHIMLVVEKFSVDWVMMTIVLFYFGGGLTESLYRGKKKANGTDSTSR